MNNTFTKSGWRAGAGMLTTGWSACVQAMLLALPLAQVSAADNNEEQVPEGPQPAEIRIATERCGGIADRVYWHYYDPDVTLRSYAAVDHGGCSGTMIGPNTMLTAAHCGPGTRTDITFRAYRSAGDACGGTDPGRQTGETFDCEYLLYSFADSDLSILFCDPNDHGENPGDKYGYLDFDVVTGPDRVFDYAASRSTKLVPGTELYSVWTNPLDDIGGQHMLYSQGSLTDPNVPDAWFNPVVDPGGFACKKGSCVGGPNPGLLCNAELDDNACGDGGICVTRPTRNICVETDLWSNPGASGSSHIARQTHRLLLGPLSTGPLDAPNRQQLSIADYLYWGWADPVYTDCPDPIDDHVNRDFLSGLGISDPTVYYGSVDKNQDGIFDVQHDLERLFGEGQRDWYWLGFESVRRNALWDYWTAPLCPGCPSPVTFDTSDPVTGVIQVNTVGSSAPGYLPILSHDRLNLRPDRFYRISFMANVSEVTQQVPVRVCLRSIGPDDCVTLDMPTGIWTMRVARLWAGPAASLEFSVKSGTRVSLVAVSVVEDGAEMDFDTHDKRYTWRNQNTGGRGLIWPNGEVEGVMDVLTWAGVVRRDPLRPGTDDYPLRNRQMAVQGGYDYRTCFSHRKAERDPLTGSISGIVRTNNESGSIPGSATLFAPGDSWTTECTDWFSVPSDDNNLQFGVFTADANAAGAYLVDRVLVERRSPSTIYVDWRNDGLNENGTPAEPYSMVAKGANSVRDDGNVIIAAGAYVESLSIGRPMWLTAANGLVAIGG